MRSILTNLYKIRHSTIEKPKVIAEASYPSEQDIENIVTGAHTALTGPWKDYSGTQRAHLLNNLANLIEKHNHTIATIESLNSGKTYAIASTWDVPHTVEVFRYYASLASTIAIERIDRNDGSWVEIVKSPVGVVGAIIPWNYPLAMAAWKLAPALAAGCTVVLKTSEFTPLSMLYVAELIREAGFPPSVANIITGEKPVGQALVRHASISKVAFTGSTKAGKSIMKDAAETLKPVTLETGGKSPLIVFEDADVDEAVRHAHEGVFQNQGQVCTATSRILVHNSILKEFLRRFKDVTERLSVVGDPFNEQTFQGPQISAAHLEKITHMASHARLEGKTVKEVWQPPITLPSEGFFMAPTIIHLTSATAAVWREEIFGPVACVMGFDTEDEALALANETEYGLAGAVCTGDGERRRRVALGLQAGTVWVGCNQDCDVRVPFGGWKESGIGRELGVDGLEGYLLKKAVYFSG